jgi:hypothetical protein
MFPKCNIQIVNAASLSTHVLLPCWLLCLQSGQMTHSAAHVRHAGLLNGDAASLQAAMEFFKSEFPKDTPLALISSKRDSIARPEDLERLFVVATEAREVSKEFEACVPTHSGQCVWVCCEPAVMCGPSLLQTADCATCSVWCSGHNLQLLHAGVEVQPLAWHAPS